MTSVRSMCYWYVVNVELQALLVLQFLTYISILGLSFEGPLLRIPWQVSLMTDG